MGIGPGTKLGVFEIIGLLGKGGMGEVYRATDSKLGRDVAIKVLPEAFASDSEWMSRFECEARVLASLNLSNVATVYGFEYDAEEGVRYIVMEHIDGETLGARIGGKRLSIADVLPLFIDIALGLETAHEAGIIHRDLKPDNVKINGDSVVKILDFGLAKSVSEAEACDPDAPTVPMTATPPTGEGTVVGTAQYMSPEQARAAGALD
ncbi:MAG: serine/threonine-protein kinase [Candidatus Hydrogenedentota bacterium]